MNPLLVAALEYAARGWHVFPLHGIRNGRCTCNHRDCSSPGKHPLTRHGMKDASVDPEVVKNWWQRWTKANIGVATGGPSGIVVVDIDLGHRTNTAFGSPGEEREGQDRDVWSSIDRVLHKLPRTLTGLTGGGGLHLLYRARSGQGLRNRASALPGMPDLHGIDLRADGGYVVVPPSIHASGNSYAWLDAASGLVDAPAWLQEPPRHETPAAPPSPPRYSSGEGTAYGLAALDNALASLAQAPVGQRNHTLNRVAFNLARLVAGGHLLESAARAELTRVALAIGLNSWETARTIGSAFGAGLTQPRVAPHRLGSS